MSTHTRLYNCSDTVFIPWTSQVTNIITKEHVSFESFSAYFTPERPKELQVLYEEAIGIPSDKVYIDIQAKATDNLNIAIDEAGKFYQSCKFDIEMIFPNDKHIWNQFGFNDFEPTRRSARNMYMFFSDFLLIANIHKEPLLTGGWVEDHFTKIQEHRDKLKMYMDQQTECIVSRSTATDKRIVTLNKMYEKLARYTKAAKIIYAGNEEMLKWFKFPVSTNGKKEEEENPEAAQESEMQQ
eukprot:TRINITY_DN4894_c0_g1_i1.p1 TRINITY_DN4894_c0_g1~~TRINITY_DN4894_c0_g1_i1.p1  ORF type:complete len:240 (-),score=-3.09 TRINITY_DN4894_c0_g1_i1:260-979(-)